MSNTPYFPAPIRRVNVRTWVNSQWKNSPLPGRNMISLMPPTDNTQKRHVQHSVLPRPNQTGQRSNMGQFSVEKLTSPGSVLNGNQHLAQEIDRSLSIVLE